jgi:hypothetical protein
VIGGVLTMATLWAANDRSVAWWHATAALIAMAAASAPAYFAERRARAARPGAAAR